MKYEISEEYLIYLMYRNTLGICSRDDAIKIIAEEKAMGNFDLQKSIKAMLEV